MHHLSPIGSGRKRHVNQVNYHTMTNDAVLPLGDYEDAKHYHYHTKVLKDKSRLPTLRPNLSPVAVLVD